MTGDGKCWEKSVKLPHTINVHETSVLVFENPVEEETELHILGGSGNYGKTHYKLNSKGWSVASELPYHFCSGKAVSLGNELHILGGSESTTNIHYTWDGGIWEKALDLPYDIAGATAVVFGKSIHLIGGKGSYKRNHYKLMGEWEKIELPSTIGDISFASSVVYNGCIHVLGGTESNGHYLFDTSNWSVGEPIPTDANTTSGQSAIAGITNSSETKRLWIGGQRAYYLSDNNSWVGYQEFPRNISHGSICELNGELVLLSGTKIYSISNPDNIEEITGINVSDSTIVKDGNKIHILGSSVSGYENNHSVIYDDGSWEVEENLPITLRNISAVLYDDEIHMIGECDNYYNHYKLTKDGGCENISTTPFKTKNGQRLVSLNGKIYGVTLLNDNGELHLIMYSFNNGQWVSVSDTKLGSYYESDNYIDNYSLVVFQNRIHVLLNIASQNILKHLVWCGSEFLSYDTINITNWESMQAIAFGNYIHIFGYNGIVTEHLITQYELFNHPAIIVHLEAGHTFLCDKTAFLPSVGIVEEVEHGYRSTDSGVYQFLMVKESPYSIS